MKKYFNCSGVLKSSMKAFGEFSKKCITSPRFATMLCFGLVATTMLAQSSTGDYSTGLKAMDDVTSNIVKYVPYVRKLIFGIAGVVGVAGLISTYWAMQNDEQDVKKRLMMTIGSCVFLIATGIALPKFFGIDG